VYNNIAQPQTQTQTQLIYHITLHLVYPQDTSCTGIWVYVGSTRGTNCIATTMCNRSKQNKLWLYCILVVFIFNVSSRPSEQWYDGAFGNIQYFYIYNNHDTDETNDTMRWALNCVNCVQWFQCCSLFAVDPDLALVFLRNPITSNRITSNRSNRIPSNRSNRNSNNSTRILRYHIVFLLARCTRSMHE
jgi:hypothetical protein